MQTELKFISHSRFSSILVSGIMIFFTILTFYYAGLTSEPATFLYSLLLLLPAIAGIITGQLIKSNRGNNFIIEILIPLLAFLLLDYLFHLLRGTEPGLVTQINNDFLKAGISFRMNNLLAAALMIIFLRINFTDLKDYILRVSLMITVLLVLNYSGVTYFYTLLSSFSIVLAARALIMSEQNSNAAAGYIMIVLTSLFLSTTTTGIILSLFHSLYAWRADFKRLAVSAGTTLGGALIFRSYLLTDTLGIISALNPLVLIFAAVFVFYLGWITVTPEEVYLYSGIISFILASSAFIFSDTPAEIYILALSSVVPLLVSSAGYYRVDRYLGRVMT